MRWTGSPASRRDSAASISATCPAGTSRSGEVMASRRSVAEKCSTIIRASSPGSSMVPSASRLLASVSTAPSVIASAFSAGIGQQPRLVIGDQRVDDLVELAQHHAIELVERQVDAVIGDAPLREIVGADALGTV